MNSLASLDRAVDVLVAEHLSPDLEAALQVSLTPALGSDGDGEMVEQDAVECLRLLDVREVRRVVEDREPRAGDRTGEVLGVARRRGHVVGARDDERRRLDPPDGPSRVPVGERLAARRVALARDGLEHRAEARDDVGVVARERGREAPEHGLGDRGRSTGTHGAGPVVPHRRLAEARRRAGEDEPVDAIRRVQSERHPDRAAERDAAERRLLDLEEAEELHDLSARSSTVIGLSGAGDSPWPGWS